MLCLVSLADKTFSSLFTVFFFFFFKLGAIQSQMRILSFSVDFCLQSTVKTVKMLPTRNINKQSYFTLPSLIIKVICINNILASLFTATFQS